MVPKNTMRAAQVARLQRNEGTQPYVGQCRMRIRVSRFVTLSACPRSGGMLSQTWRTRWLFCLAMVVVAAGCSKVDPRAVQKLAARQNARLTRLEALLSRHVHNAATFQEKAATAAGNHAIPNAPERAALKAAMHKQTSRCKEAERLIKTSKATVVETGALSAKEFRELEARASSELDKSAQAVSECEQALRAVTNATTTLLVAFDADRAAHPVLMRRGKRE